MKIGLVGLGRLGLPVALAIESKGHEIAGHDISQKVVDIVLTKVYPHREQGVQQLLEKSRIRLMTLNQLAEFSDIIFVAIQTPHDKEYEGITRMPKQRRNFDYMYLRQGMDALAEEIGKAGQDKVVVIISTVLPGTIRREIIPLLNNEHVRLCYNPFFIAMGTTINDFLIPEFVLCGSEDWGTAKMLKQFYKTIHDKPFVRMSIESAELCKVAYNTAISSKIVLANTMMEICQKIPRANVDDVTNALALATDRILSPRYMTGGMGDGGGCHPRDLIAMSWLARDLRLSHNIYDDLARTREDQTAWLADLIIEKQRETSIFNIVILGKAFKRDTNLVDGSPAILLKSILREKGYGYMVSMYDPHVDGEAATVQNVPCIFFIGTNHDEFKTFPFPRGSVVIDPWRYIPEQDGVEVIGIGSA